MAQKAGWDHRRFVVQTSQIETTLVRALSEDDAWLARIDESALRWALSLARVSLVPGQGGSPGVDIGHATDLYRERLFNLLDPILTEGRLKSRNELIMRMPQVRRLVADERRELLELYRGRFSADALDEAVRQRPLALALGGGGGTAFVFTGAFAELEEAGIRPSAIAGSSMGSVLGAYRALHLRYDLRDLKRVMASLSWDRVVQPLQLQQGSRFGVPATFRLYLREVFGHEFERDGQFMRLCDLPIPLRVTVAGILHIEGGADPDLNEYAHLLDDVRLNPREIAKKERSVMRTLLQFATKPLRAIYLGQDELTAQFDVLDAIGFSSAVPGVFHYDILRNDARMVELVQEMMRRQGVVRLIDGGFADNLPSLQAKLAVQSNLAAPNDPFVLALDGFAPSLTQNWAFLPLMRAAAENSRRGREEAHHTITYRNVLSPLNVVPSRDDLERTIANGRAETAPHIPFIRKMLGPIPDPPGVVSEMDGDVSSVL